MNARNAAGSAPAAPSGRADDRAPARRRFPAAALGRALPPAAVLLAAALAWELWTLLADVPEYIVPAPSAALSRLFGDLAYFAGESAVTLGEAVAGFALGSLAALAAAALMAHSKIAERALYPIAILIKVTPIVAVAPLFVIWFGFGPVPKALIAALITFFPVLVNGVTGFRSVDGGALDFMRSLRASRREIFLKLRLPSAMPFVFAAFRVAVPLSLIGAVVAEWFSGDRGLGSVIIVAYSNLDMPTLFAAILALAGVGVALTAAVSALEKRVLFWHQSQSFGDF